MLSFGVSNLRRLKMVPPIALKPITILVGRNSSGKSSFLRAFPLLRQSIMTRTSSPILWYGDLVDFGSFNISISDNTVEEPITFSFAMDSLDSVPRPLYWRESPERNKYDGVHFGVSIIGAGERTRISRITADVTSNLVKTGNEVKVALSRLSSYSILEKSILLLENVDSDGDFYAFILDNHSASFNCDHVSFECSHGGGADLPKVFSRIVESGRIVCAVGDSDRYAPCSKEYKVAQLSKISDSLKWSLSFPSTPPCREVENMIPMDIVLKLPSAVGNSANKIHLMVDAAESSQGLSEDELFWLYCDLKEGLRPDKFRKLAAEEREWLCAKLNLAGLDPEEESINGYGEKIVKQLFADGRLISELRYLTRHRSWLNVFSSFFENLAWAFIATPRTRT